MRSARGGQRRKRVRLDVLPELESPLGTDERNPTDLCGQRGVGIRQHHTAGMILVVLRPIGRPTTSDLVPPIDIPVSTVHNIINELA